MTINCTNTNGVPDLLKLLCRCAPAPAVPRDVRHALAGSRCGSPLNEKLHESEARVKAFKRARPRVILRWMTCRPETRRSPTLQ
jgi:hypothetical protein